MIRWWRWLCRRIPASGSVGVGVGGRKLALALAVICCFPVLLPLSCLCFPLLCLVAACLRLGFRRNSPPDVSDEGAAGAVAALLGRREGREVEERRLMQRYLEDQLGLVGLGWDLDDANGEEG